MQVIAKTLHAQLTSNRENLKTKLEEFQTQQDGKNLINLESILTIEDALWSMLEAFRSL